MTAPYRRVLVGLDLSRLSDLLVDWLPVLAKAGVEEYRLLHVISSTAIPTEILHRSPLGPHFMSLMNDLKGVVSEKLEKYASILAEKGLKAVVMPPVIGDPAREIVRLADEAEADAIVVGSRGMGWLSAKLLGSVSEGVVHMADKTVIVARFPRRDDEPLRPRDPWGRLLVAIDLEFDSEIVLDEAAMLAKLTGSELIVVHVVEREEDKARAQDRLNSLLQKARVKAAQTLVPVGSPAEKILEAARSLDATSIVVGPHSKSFFRPLLGSVADNIVRWAETPVIVVKTPKTV